jgi:hypothetical protein
VASLGITNIGYTASIIILQWTLILNDELMNKIADEE